MVSFRFVLSKLIFNFFSFFFCVSYCRLFSRCAITFVAKRPSVISFLYFSSAFNVLDSFPLSSSNSTLFIYLFLISFGLATTFFLLSPFSSIHKYFRSSSTSCFSFLLLSLYLSLSLSSPLSHLIKDFLPDRSVTLIYIFALSNLFLFSFVSFL